MFFYELHEGDNEVFSDVLVVSESEWEPDEFFELVQTIRRRIQDGYIHDTLSEAIAVELERDHGFIHVSDDRLVASVNVSTDDEQNFLADLEVDLADAEEELLILGEAVGDVDLRGALAHRAVRGERHLDAA